MFLTPDELAELTGKTRRGAQSAELHALGIPFRTRRDGSIVVLRVERDGATSGAVALARKSA